MISSLNHTMRCYFQGHTKHFFCFSVGELLNRKPDVSCSASSSRPYVFSSDEIYSTGSRRGRRGWSLLQPRSSICRFDWPLPAGTHKLPLSIMVIYIFHFVTPTLFRSTTWLLIFTCESCVENLWLTARSKVNMQYNFLVCKQLWIKNQQTFFLGQSIKSHAPSQ